MTHTSSALSIERGKLRLRLDVDLATIAAAVLFLTVCAVEIALIWHNASAIDPTSLMGLVT